MASIICGSCKDRHASVAEVRDCHAEADAYEAERYAEAHAEAVSSWVSGGGSYSDALRYAAVVASGKSWGEFLQECDEEFASEAEAAGECEHGLSAALCAGPGHYPMDDPSDF